jgi:hypothetical protein
VSDYMAFAIGGKFNTLQREKLHDIISDIFNPDFIPGWQEKAWEEHKLILLQEGITKYDFLTMYSHIICEFDWTSATQAYSSVDGVQTIKATSHVKTSSLNAVHALFKMLAPYSVEEEVFALFSYFDGEATRLRRYMQKKGKLVMREEELDIDLHNMNPFAIEYLWEDI